jgi:hypothetical protein
MIMFWATMIASLASSYEVRKSLGYRVGEGNESVAEVYFLRLLLKLDELVILPLANDALVKHLLDLALGVLESEGVIGGPGLIDCFLHQLFACKLIS